MDRWLLKLIHSVTEKIVMSNIIKPIDTLRNVEQLIINQAVDIPVFHEVALRLLQMMNEHTYRIEEVIILVNKDTALAAEMLRHANTTYNSGKTPITTIKNAIVRLGSQQIVNLAFTASMANSRSKNPIINSYLKDIWCHSHAVATISAFLAIQATHDKDIIDLDADEAYLAGLFHDIGKLYLLKLMDILVNKNLMQADRTSIDLVLEELNIQQGIRVLKHYNIPDLYIDSVERLVDDNWKCGKNDYLVAAVRSSHKIQQYIEQGIDLFETSADYNQIEDEFLFLDIEDVMSVCNSIRVIF